MHIVDCPTAEGPHAVKKGRSRREFLKTTALTGLALSCAHSGVPAAAASPMKRLGCVSRLEKPVAIAMWDFSWVLRHHRYGEFEDWDRVLGELVERGYNAVRIDAMPQFVAAAKDGPITDEFRSVRTDWKPCMWGNDYTMRFRPREALLEFLPLCKKHRVRVGLATWFLSHGTDRKDIFNEEGGVLRAWSETLAFLEENGLLDDNILYVDLLNEYPVNHGCDWLKNELNKRSDARQFKLNNPEAHLPEHLDDGGKGDELRTWFYNDFMSNLIQSLKNDYPDLDFFASLDQGLDRIDLTHYDALDFHIWFAHHERMGPIWKIGSERDQSIDLAAENTRLYRLWLDNKEMLVKWVEDRIASTSALARENNIVCGNTEGWGPVLWFDHPELDWRFTKEAAEICVDSALKHDNYKFICTSNFTHPQFRGMWEDVKWHQQITRRITG